MRPSRWEWRFHTERDRRYTELAEAVRRSREEAIKELHQQREEIETLRTSTVSKAEFQPVEDYVTREIGRLGGVLNARSLLTLGALVVSALVNVYLVIRG